MARKAGQIIARGQSTWLVRVYLGRDTQSERASITTRPSTVHFARRNGSSI